MNNTELVNGYVLPVVKTKLVMDVPLFSNEEIKKPEDVVNLLGTYLADLAYENSAVVCFDVDMCPICVSIIGSGTNYMTPLPARNVIQTAMLTNAAGVAIVHNHPTHAANNRGLEASKDDVESLDAIMKICRALGIELYDSIILSYAREGDAFVPKYYSMREKMIKHWKNKNLDKYAKGIPRELARKEHFLNWENDFATQRDDAQYWGADVQNLPLYQSITAYSPEELREAVRKVNSGAFDRKQEHAKAKTPEERIRELEAALAYEKSKPVFIRMIEDKMKKGEYTKVPEAIILDPKYSRYVRELKELEAYLEKERDGTER